MVPNSAVSTELDSNFVTKRLHILCATVLYSGDLYYQGLEALPFMQLYSTGITRLEVALLQAMKRSMQQYFLDQLC